MKIHQAGAFVLVSSLFTCAAQANLVTLNFNDFTEPFVWGQNPGGDFQHRPDLYQVENAELRKVPDGSPGSGLIIFETSFAFNFPPCMGCTYPNNGSGVLWTGRSPLELTMHGSQFTLEQIDLLQAAFNPGSSAVFESYLDGQLTGSMSLLFSDSFPSYFDALDKWHFDVSGGALGVMDRLVIKGDPGTVTSDSRTDFWADNIRVRAVPEPGSLMLLSGALAAAGFAGWRRRKLPARG
jgi:hypothetical protein